MNQDKYKVGGRGKALPLEDALAKAKRIYLRTGVFAAVERIIPRRKGETR